jgi:NADPH:quinone reductase-like Zn-dependent oxidoreductase
MSQLTLTAVGGELAETVSLNGHSRPEIGDDEVLVAVEAAPINNADLLFAAGWFAVYPTVPSELGAEGVGRVVRAGANTDASLIGRRVVILPTFEHGTWADETVVPADRVIPVPEDVDALQLAMLPVNPATAYSLLHDYVSLKPGDWIGLDLANSAVGQYLIALARRAGIKTLAVVRRAEAAEQVERLGADIVLVDGDDLTDRAQGALAGSKLRLLADGTGDPAVLAKLAPLVEDGGQVVAFSSATGQAPALPLPDLIYRGISLRGFLILDWIRTTPREELERVYGELAELVADGAIGSAVEATYPLSDFQTALAHAARSGRAGKVLFTPNGR